MKHISKAVLFSMLAWVVAGGTGVSETRASSARNHFVAPNGTAEGDGSLSQPWSLEAALANPANVSPGDVIWLREGVYRGSFRSRLAGTAEAPIIVRQYPGEQAVLEAANSSEPVLSIEEPEVWFWGLEVRGAHVRADAEGAMGINIRGSRTKLISMIIHGLAAGVLVDPAAADVELHGNLLYDNGGRIEGKLLADNIVIDQSGGLLSLGSPSSDHGEFVVDGNIVFHTSNFADNATRQVSIFGQPYYRGNSVYASVAGALSVAGPCPELVLEDNYVVGNVALVGCDRAVANGNSFRGALTGLPDSTNGNSVEPGAKAGTMVVLRPNRLDHSRANVAVFNEDSRASAHLDIQGLLQPGDRYEVRAAEDYFGTPVAGGAYNGSPIEIPLTSAEFEAFVLTRLESDGEFTETEKNANAKLAVSANDATAAFNDQDLGLWLRADAGVVTSDSAVSQWNNQATPGTSASQPTSSKRPALVSNAINGKPALRFDGINDQLNFSLPVNGRSGLTLLLVSASDNVEDGGEAGQEGAPLLWQESGPWGSVHIGSFRDLVTFRFGTGETNNGATYKRPSSLGSNFSLTTAMKNGAAETLFVNGQQVFAVQGKRAALDRVASQARLGLGFPGVYFNGKIAEVLVFTRALSTSERQSVEQYLMSKYFNAAEPPQTAPNTRPSAQNRSVTTSQNTAVAVALVASDPDGDDLTYQISQAPAKGRLSGTAPALTYTPNTSFSGTDQFQFQVNDGRGGTATGTVTITVRAAAAPAPPPPQQPEPEPEPGPQQPNPSVPSGAVVIQPGMSIQDAVDSHAAGTAFLIKAGVHRLQEVVPKNGNTFVGEPGAVLSGARLLTNLSRQGSYWVASGQTQQSSPHGECLSSSPRCFYAEDVYINDVLQKHVSSLSQVGPGRFYFDYSGDRIYIGQDPAGRKVEAAVSRYAFDGSASNVTIRGLIIEKYGSRGQYGTIMGSRGTGWIIEDNDVRWNHGVGIVSGPSGKVLRNKVRYNGQLGMAADGSHVLVEGNEIAYNNTAGYESGWEAGGTKFAETADLTVRGNHVHHNYGFGLWTDIDNIRTTYEDNLVTDNEHVGIFHEISYAAIIRNNTVLRNGKTFDPWLWGAQILVAGSQDVEVYGNTVVVAAEGGNGIGLIQQDRGTGRYGPWKTRNNYVHHNDVTYLGEGMSGAVADHDETGMLTGNNRFDFNTYRFTSDGTRWHWGDEKDWSGFRAAGHERNGRVVNQVTPPTQ